jgi:ATP phosphoribosyltransferase
MITVALPKGRLGDKVYEMFSKIGYDCSAALTDSRKLVIEDDKNAIRYILVKPSDVSIYVEHGCADIGVVGKDILMETGSDVYELLDLKTGVCRVVVAGKKDYVEDVSIPLRVATKYVNITKSYFSRTNRVIEIIKLNGSIELAPILGLSDVIVDIVQTGTTLRENNLTVLKEIAPSSARLIANKSSYHFLYDRIEEIKEKLEKIK